MTPEEAEAMMASLDDYAPESEAQRVFVELQKIRAMTGDKSSVATMDAVKTIAQICRPEGATPEDIGRASFMMMLLGAERDALRILVDEYRREREDIA